MRRFRVISLAAALALGLAAPTGAEQAAGGAATPAPARVVSMNLCTDQLAMLIAAEGQLISVSDVAFDPFSSAMSEEAAGYLENHGLAEEIYLMKPDLVLAGAFSDRATLAMLERLGISVVRLDVARRLQDVPERMRQVGAALRREAQAEELVADYEARLAGFRAAVARRPRAALYYANGYTLGDNSLSGQILLAAGFDNVATQAGIEISGTLPLEVLAMQAPEALITGTKYPGASRSEDILHHPVIETLRQRLPGAGVTGRDWLCGTPHVLRAVETMARLRHEVAAEAER